MTVLIPLKKAYDDNIELRYALRSFVNCFPIERLIIVGYCPPWLKGAEVIHFQDSTFSHDKENNISDKILKGFEHVENFLFANDDHYISPDFNPWHNYYEGTLSSKKAICRPGIYYQTIEQTLRLIGDQNYYDIHCPIMYARDKFPSLARTKFGYCLKTVYAKAAKLSGVETIDCKVKDKKASYMWLNDKLFFSSSEACFHPRFFEYLQLRWPDPSQFEKY